MKFIQAPKIYLVGRQYINEEALQQFLEDNETTWETDTEIGSERISELAGRICYMSLGKQQGRRTNQEYLENILEQKHGSVLEHAVWNFVISGVSRSLTHELVRHRAGVAFSQLSQRYVDESEVEFVEPSLIKEDAELHSIWAEAVNASHEAYIRLAEKLTEKVNVDYPTLPKRERRKLVRESARSILPNATETKLMFSANSRALRHIIELRGGLGAEAEIRRFSVELLKVLQVEAPNIFGDFTIKTLDDGKEGVEVKNSKV